MTASWAEAATLRQGLYRFFGEALSPPTREWVDVVVPAAEWLDGLGVEPFAFSRQWQGLRAVIAGPIDLRLLEPEYVRLFSSAMDPSVSPPTESYYRTTAKGGGTAEFLADLVREYLAMGITVVGKTDAPDHATAELEVMSMLCAQEADAWESERLDLVSVATEKQARFLRRHLTVWFPTFKDHVLAANPGPLYRALVETTHAFLIHDADLTQAIRAGTSS